MGHFIILSFIQQTHTDAFYAAGIAGRRAVGR
jgi:hypothetical protein